jgi:ankyrin repeat protein
MDLMKQLDKRSMWQKNGRHNKPLEIWEGEWIRLQDEIGGEDTDFYKRRLDALQDLLDRPWFSRIWVLQEVASAKSAVVACGWDCVSTRTFALMPAFMGVHVNSQVQAVLDIMPGYLRKETLGDTQHDLRTLLDNFKSCASSRPHDMIYALLGISSDANDSRIFPPDYELPIKDVISRTISFLIFGRFLDATKYRLPRWNLRKFLRNITRLNAMVFEWALRSHNEPLATRFLEEGVFDVNESIQGIGIPLCFLVSRNNRNICRVILQREDIDVNSKDNGLTALYLAAKLGFAEKVALLLTNNSIDVSDRSEGLLPLEAAAREGHYSVVKLLLDHDANRVCQESYKDPMYQSSMALWYAAERDHADVAELLAGYGIDLEHAAGSSQSTALWIAASKGHVNIVDLLIRKGANLETRNLTNISIQHIAARGGHTNVVQCVFDAITSKKAKYFFSRDVLWTAATYEHVEMMQLIIAISDVDVDSRDLNGKTALWISAYHGHIKTARLLISKGANTELQNRQRETALWIAAQEGHQELCELLVANGANIEAEDVLKTTPLWISAICGYVDIVRFLLQNGANPLSPSMLARVREEVALGNSTYVKIQALLLDARNRLCGQG